MVDGAAYLMGAIWGLRGIGLPATGFEALVVQGHHGGRAAFQLGEVRSPLRQDGARFSLASLLLNSKTFTSISVDSAFIEASSFLSIECDAVLISGGFLWRSQSSAD